MKRSIMIITPVRSVRLFSIDFPLSHYQINQLVIPDIFPAVQVLQIPICSDKHCDAVPTTNNNTNTTIVTSRADCRQAHIQSFSQCVQLCTPLHCINLVVLVTHQLSWFRSITTTSDRSLYILSAINKLIKSKITSRAHSQVYAIWICKINFAIWRG